MNAYSRNGILRKWHTETVSSDRQRTAKQADFSDGFFETIESVPPIANTLVEAEKLVTAIAHGSLNVKQAWR